MSLVPGAQFGPYEILSPIGAGGMGEVYRAHDPKLDRDVAIKILRGEFARDEERLARFEREAKLLASLNHPNIASVYELEESGGVKGLVLELVEGPTLAERIGQGAIPVDEAIAIARQIAEALEAGHEAGVIHRDLKPANVKLKEDDTVKVLDYGLAKALGDDAPGDGDAELSQSPTLTRQRTQAGVILGTAAYMSPEQARGKRVDRRTDIWAFGAVLYEMLTGQRLFTGETITDVLAAVVRQEIEWSRIPGATPEGVKRLVQRCLDRDPRRRLRDIGEARVALEEDPAAAEGPAEPRRGGLARTAAIALASAAMGVLGALQLGTLGAPEAPLRALHIDSGERIEMPQISRDGRAVVYVRNDRLVVRELDAFETRELDGTEDASNPFWSDDGASLGYFVREAGQRELRTIPARGGASQVLAGTRGSVFAPFGGAFCRGGVIFVRWASGLWFIDDDGQETTLARIDRSQNETNLSYPHCLPDGRVLAVIQSGDKIAIAIFDSDRRTILLELPADEYVAWPVFVTEGYILFERSEPNPGIWAVPVSDDVSSTTGPPVLILPVGRQPSVSSDGVLVSLSGTQRVDRRLVWVDRQGQRLSEFGRPAREFMNPSVSPDGARAVVSYRIRGGSMQIWVHHEATAQRINMNPDGTGGAAFSPSGDRIAYAASDGLYVGPAESLGEPKRIVETTEVRVPEWSADGRHLVYQTRRPDEGQNIWLVGLTDSAEPSLLLENAETPAISPDGRMLAFASRSTGRREIYVTTFPEPGRIWPVSVDGGRYPQWSPRDGELFFTAGPVVEHDPNSHRDLYVATLDTGTEVTISRPEKLFDAESLGLRLNVRAARGYDVGPDGQRFLVQTSGIEGVPTIAIIQDVAAWIRNRT